MPKIETLAEAVDGTGLCEAGETLGDGSKRQVAEVFETPQAFSPMIDSLADDVVH